MTIGSCYNKHMDDRMILMTMMLMQTVSTDDGGGSGGDRSRRKAPLQAMMIVVITVNSAVRLSDVDKFASSLNGTHGALSRTTTTTTMHLPSDFESAMGKHSHIQDARRPGLTTQFSPIAA